MDKNIKVYFNDANTINGILRDDKLFVDLIELTKLTNLYGKWIRQNESYKILTSNASIREIKEYKHNGNYLNFDKIKVENWNVNFDENGIPKTVFRWGEYYYPITIAHYGLQNYSLFLIEKNNVYENNVMKIADWYLVNQQADGGWATEFDHMYYKGRTELIKGPWYSSLGQGMAISFLVRAYHLTKKIEYLESAKKGFNIFLIPVENGGVLRKFEDKYLYYEEYPTNPASYVLNGFMYSLLGLYDLYMATSEDVYHQYYKEGIKTLKRVLPLYDLGNRTAYDLTHYTTNGEFPNVARWGYHITHVHLLMAFNAIEEDERLLSIQKRWINYTKGSFVKEN